jgi:serine/threonine protein kinase
MATHTELPFLLSNTRRELLVDLIREHQRSGPVNAMRFRATHDQGLADIDSLESEGWIRRENDIYGISIVGLSETRTLCTEAESILFLCGFLFDRLKPMYKKDPGRKVLLTDLAKEADLPLSEILKAMPYLKQASLFGGWGSDESAADAYVILGENLIRKQTFEQVIEEQRDWMPRRRPDNFGAPEVAAAGGRRESGRLFNTALESYTVVKQIGQGGTGLVVEVRDSEGKAFALKYLRPGQQEIRRSKRFKNEIRFGMRSAHSNIVPVLDFGKGVGDDDDAPFFVMPLYPLTLRHSIANGLSPQDAMRIFEHLLSGIEAAHAKGVCHRDLKPENVLLTADFYDVRIADFGIANFSEEEIYADAETRAGDRFGNFVYAAPEQRVREAAQDFRVDFFSLGLILNELFTREVPHGSGYLRISSVDPAFSYLDDVVESLIQQNPANRPSSTDEIRKLLAEKRGTEAAKRPTMTSSTVFFSERFTSSFPGIRGISVIDSPGEGIRRLQRLLQEPLRFGDSIPIWWWRSGNMGIETFSILNKTTVLLDCQELIIDEVAAINAGAYYQQLVYVQAKPSEPSGLYKNLNMERSVADFGFAREEFGIYEGHFITRAEYDDGAAVIDGKLVDFKVAPELRVRYLTPYNLIVAAHDSPINDGAFDDARDTVMNAILRGEAALEDLVKMVLKLPKRSRH